MNEKELLNRIKNALIIVKTGKAFVVDKLTLSAKNKNTFVVAGTSRKKNIEEVRKSLALKELHEVKMLFKSMLLISSELSEFIKQREVSFHLYFNYGMGELEICSDIEGKTKWELEIKE